MLTALLSGESANVAEDCSDDLIIRRALIILKEIFGSKKAARTDLKSYQISRWSKNPYIKGAYSYMAVGASGDGKTLCHSYFVKGIYLLGYSI